MSEVDLRSRTQPLLPSGTPGVRRGRQGADGEGFERSLRRLESSPATPELPTSSEAEPAMMVLPERIDAFDTATEMTDVMEQRDNENSPVGVAVTAAVARAAPSSEPGPAREGSWLDPASEALVPHIPSAPDLVPVEQSSQASAVMNLNDFATSLQRVGQPTNPNGEQVWRFTLQDSALPLHQIALTGAASGHWSVALSAQANEQAALAQHLQWLRARLDRLERGVTRVAIERDETS